MTQTVPANLPIPANLEAAAARGACDRKDLERFARHLGALPVHQAARINPFAFAEAAGIGSETALDLFVHGTKLGVFDLEWGAVCPLCGAITNSVAALDQVAEESLDCALCNREAPSVLDDTIEVTFAYAPPGSTMELHQDFDTYQRYYISSSYPYREDWLGYHKRHTVGDVRLEPGQIGIMPVRLSAGEAYRLLCLDTHSGAELRATDDQASAAPTGKVTLSLSDRGFSAREVSLSSSVTALELTNQTEQTVWCRLLRIDIDDVMAIMQQGPADFGPRVTGKHLLNNQAFRDSFALHELAPDLKLKLRSLTLLFTDLKGSTALYDREGDLAAYRLVQDHFGALKQVVRDHAGAVIKTMGDAVMAAFPNGRDGAAAAISMMTAMEKLADGSRDQTIGLKVGLHAGPALAINAGRNLDYFGQTVNIAARVQGLADAGDICLTGVLNNNDAIPALLAAAGYDGSAEFARLKGVSAEEKIFRYRSAS